MGGALCPQWNLRRRALPSDWSNIHVLTLFWTHKWKVHNHMGFSPGWVCGWVQFGRSLWPHQLISTTYGATCTVLERPGGNTDYFLPHYKRRNIIRNCTFDAVFVYIWMRWGDIMHMICCQSKEKVTNSCHSIWEKGNISWRYQVVINHS